jgi:uncharacterized protein DUF4229
VPFAIYSVLRLALLGACLGVLWLVGMRSWLVVVVAAFLAWGLSYVLLKGPRDAAALQIARRVERRATQARRSQQDAAVEDAADDAARHEPGPAGP